jgi:hypothetical protein
MRRDGMIANSQTGDAPPECFVKCPIVFAKDVRDQNTAFCSS